jgi:hypothetical protein
VLTFTYEIYILLLVVFEFMARTTEVLELKTSTGYLLCIHSIVHPRFMYPKKGPPLYGLQYNLDEKPRDHHAFSQAPQTGCPYMYTLANYQICDNA